jgi:hypothetical protein
VGARLCPPYASNYFRIASVHHYLIVDLDQRIVIHHRRDSGDAIATKIMGQGSLQLDPPGIDLAIADVFRA